MRPGMGRPDAFTARVRDVDLVTLPPVADTVTGYEPVGVDAAVVRVRVEEQVGVQDAGEYE